MREYNTDLANRRLSPILFVLIFIGSMLTLTSTASAQVSALFQSGVVAEYDAPNANRNDGATTFSDLNITSVIMSQPYSAWGDSTGTQGNDTDVFLKINFSDKASISRPLKKSAVQNGFLSARLSGFVFGRLGAESMLV